MSIPSLPSRALLILPPAPGEHCSKELGHRDCAYPQEAVKGFCPAVPWMGVPTTATLRSESAQHHSVPHPTSAPYQDVPDSLLYWKPPKNSNENQTLSTQTGVMAPRQQWDRRNCRATHHFGSETGTERFPLKRPCRSHPSSVYFLFCIHMQGRR